METIFCSYVVLAISFYIITSMSATLANVITNNYRLLAICDHCAHTVELDMDRLVERNGADYLVPAIKQRLLCRPGGVAVGPECLIVNRLRQSSQGDIGLMLCPAPPSYSPP